MYEWEHLNRWLDKKSKINQTFLQKTAQKRNKKGFGTVTKANAPLDKNNNGTE